MLSNGSSFHGFNAIRADTRVSIGGSAEGNAIAATTPDPRSASGIVERRAKKRRKGERYVNSAQLAGGWSGFSFTITTEAKEVFDRALKGFVGVKYTPLAFATQVVAGLNYCFVCRAQVAAPGTTEYLALVNIYAPPGGDPHITGIRRINPGEH